MAYKNKRSRSRRSCARANVRSGPSYRAGLFIGGLAYGLMRSIFFKNNF